MERQAPSFEERLDRLVEGFLQQASTKPSGPEIAARVLYSVAQTHRIFKSAYGEPPGAFRRRLVLERAADLLARTQQSVWKIAFESGFESSEAFGRAFRRAFNTSPRAFRKAPTHGWLPAPSTVHYWRGSLLKTMATGETDMNLTERLVEHDLADTRKMLEHAQTLRPEHLDKKVAPQKPTLFLECAENTLRGRLSYIVATKECWLAAVYGRTNPMTQGTDDSATGMLERWNAVEPEWRELVKSVESEGRWNESFIDALCEQPTTFTLGGMIAHVIDRAARDRAEAYRMFTALGRDDAAYGDPLTWELQRA
ncbi:MAG: helix-turn-helix transcriptional regulator [Fimbriimonadaceae bacterium]